MYFVVTLALKNAHLHSVNSAFSGFASLKLHLFIHSLRLWWLAMLLFSQPLIFMLNYTSTSLAKGAMRLWLVSGA